MTVIRVHTAGFCMGVGLALHKLEQEIEARKHTAATGRLIMLGPIIHNPQVLSAYAAQGVIQADTLDEIHTGDTVIIRAHGIPRPDEEKLRKLGALIVDATCPKVKKAQLAIADATAGGSPLYLFGEGDHPEVRGLVSYAAGICQVFGSLTELQGINLQTGSRAVLAAQTTQERTEFEAIRNWLEDRLDLTVLSTICDATRKRQKETQDVASQVQAMIVVGGRSSGNTRRLVDVAHGCGIPVWHIETAEELPLSDIAVYDLIGITAGASTPHKLVDDVQNLLETLHQATEKTSAR